MCSPRYMVEAYERRLSGEDLVALTLRLARAGDQPDGAQHSCARHLTTFYSPNDEMCVHVFEACGEECVRRLALSVGLTIDRIARVLESRSVRVAAEAGGWTMVATRPQGTSCGPDGP